MVKISVLMATKNGAKYISKSIDSILKQSFKDFEFIICNDYSTDSTLDILQKYLLKDKRIKIINNEGIPGFTNALNLGIKNSEGKYVARMDDDDISHHDRLQKELSFMEQNPTVSIVGSNINFFDENGIFGTTDYKRNLNSLDIWRGNIFAHPSVMIRKSDLKKVGGYSTSPRVKRIEDYDLWCNFYSKGFSGVVLKEVLLDYREDSNSFKKRDISRRIRLVSCMSKWQKEMNIPKKYNIFKCYELIKSIVPQKCIQQFHKLKYKDNV